MRGRNLKLNSWAKFTNDLKKTFSDLGQSYFNWRIHRTFTTVLRPILRQNLTITLRQILRISWDKFC